MGVKVKRNDGSIAGNELQDGDVAEVTSWLGFEHKVGRIVHRVGADLNFVGYSSDHSLTGYFVGSGLTSGRVRLLTAEDTLEVED